MSIKREFLDWRRPALPAAATLLIERFQTSGTVDLDGVIVVLPGRRAGRRLLELLVQLAEERSLLLTPPHITTMGQLPELLYEPKRPFASQLVQQLAWTGALRAAGRQLVGHVMRELPAEDDALRWMALAELISRQHTELAGDVLNFADVATRGREAHGFDESDRWQTLAKVQAAYLGTLDALELWDRQTARRVAIRDNECQTEKTIVLLGTVDMNGAMRSMLDQVADQVTVLLHAPPDWADRFDRHGCLVAEAWQNVRLDMADDQIFLAEGPPQQAGEVARCIAAWDGRFAAEQITIGLPDERIVPQLQRQLDECELPSRWGVGRPVSETAAYRLFEAVARYLERGRYGELAALVRHPDLFRWLEHQGVSGDWLTELDGYYNRHLPARLDGRWLGPADGYRQVRQAYDLVKRLLGGLNGRPRPLDQWSGPLVQILLEIYGQVELDRTDSVQRVVVESCRHIHDVLAEHQAVPESLVPRVTSAEAIRLALEQVAAKAIPPLSGEAAIELLGWLELPLDDAPALVVTSFNEGYVPKSLNSDLFLPDGLRRRLGLDDNARRYARDAYALSVLLSSRQELAVIVGRRDSEGDPLVPSRLVFAAEAEHIVKRTLDFFEPSTAAAGPSLVGNLVAGSDRSEFAVPQPQPLSEPIVKMRVTAFRKYLACPYRFYLSEVLRLESLRDSAQELDAAAFGTLIHEVLSQFGHSPQRDSTDEGEIRQRLNTSLDQCVAASYGANRLAPVILQIEQLRMRLDAFAAWQAKWAEQGWRIEHVEVPQVAGAASLTVDGEPMILRGRIDRIDVLPKTGERIVFDYKSGTTAKSPDKAHRDKDTWVDLQLPLYRHLAKSLSIDGPVRLGYIVLPKDTDAVRHLLAEWDADELAAADEVACDVVRRVRRQEFWPPTVPPPSILPECAAICQDDVFGGPRWAGDEEAV